MTRLVMGPFNRVEGDLEVTLDVDAGHVTAAHVNAPLYRGFEQMLLGRDPRDALTITPRICGICSISQSAAAARALGSAMGLAPTPQGAMVAALIHLVENVADHLTHFNLFFMPDFTRPAYAQHKWHPAALARFTAVDGSALRAATAARAELLHILGLLAGKWPHTLAIQPGGVTRAPSARDKMRISASLRAFRRYLESTVFGGRVEDFAALTTPDQLMAWDKGDVGLFLTIAADLGLDGLGLGGGRYLSFGAYPLDSAPIFAAGVWQSGTLSPVNTADIIEDVSHAWMHGPALHPAHGQTEPDADMAAPAYTWCKAPRLAGKPAETGALSRQIVDGHPLALAFAQHMGGAGVLGRVAGRMLELARSQIALETLLSQIDPSERFMQQGTLPTRASGEGLVEAARGALGHWLQIENERIAGYQIIAPTTWNFSPRDANGTAGPLESALVGAPVSDPVTVQHIVRSFDPCMVCTVH